MRTACRICIVGLLLAGTGTPTAKATETEVAAVKAAWKRFVVALFDQDGSAAAQVAPAVLAYAETVRKPALHAGADDVARLSFAK